LRSKRLSFIMVSTFLVLSLALAVSGCAKKESGAKPGAEGTPGVTDNSILLGSYQPMTGNESTYFRMGKGADAWYKYVNEELGGVNGRKIIFKMVDDGYQPARTKVVVKEFIERDRVFAIANPLGSAPTAAVIDYIAENNVPLIGAGTGAAKNVNHPSKWVWPLYLDYTREAQQLMEMARKQFSAKKIAYIYQNDPSGQTSLAGAEEYASKNGIEIVSKQGYEVAEVDVASQVITSKKANPDVLVVFAAPEHFSKILVERQRLGWKVPVVASFVGLDSRVFELAGKQAVEGVIISTIFRSPNSDDPKIAEFRRILKKYYPQEEPSAIHMWGYAGAQVITEALKRAGEDLTREKFIEAMGSIKNWKESIIPEVNLSMDQRILVSNVSWMQAKDGKFVEFQPGK